MGGWSAIAGDCLFVQTLRRRDHMVRRGNGGDGVVVTSEDSGAVSLSKWSSGNDEQSRRTSMQGMGAAAQQAPSPRLSAAGKRLAEEKSWLSELPEYCVAEPTRGSDFVWSFRVSGLHGTSYQVRLTGWWTRAKVHCSRAGLISLKCTVLFGIYTSRKNGEIFGRDARGMTCRYCIVLLY